MTDAVPPPYPADTRAKGWRFELDYEQIEQSSTWALAPAEAKPWLLMLWMVSWKQTPCGSLPDDEEVVAAMVGAPPKLWAKYRKTLMRGWRASTDGRMYHDTVTKRVMEMMQLRRRESDRKALARAKTAADNHGMDAGVPDKRLGNASNVPRDNSGTTKGLHPESSTGTGTGTCISSLRSEIQIPIPPETRATEVLDSIAPPDLPMRVSKASAVCLALKAEGIGAVNPGHPELLALISAGAEVGNFVSASAAAKGKSNPFAYVLGVVKGQMAEAQRMAQGARSKPKTKEVRHDGHDVEEPA